ncbi:MAG: IPT/TIG domain-containing protein, partial [Chitinophagaceae bacterium]|nr:IPT/TIG domain-containing protein [Chitinophagaceae bacterium]
ADGNTAIAGGYNDNSSVGAAWVFTRSGSVWTQQGNKLVGTGAVGSARQGISVSISADGNTAIVGGDYDNSNVGAAWVYTRSGGVWWQQGNKLIGTGAVGKGEQGRSVSISADGNTAIVGGYRDDNFTGAAWVYKYLPPAPTITNFTPTSAAAGAIISITGTNFTGTSVITLGGTPVTSFTVVSSTSIFAIVGAGSSGAVSLTTPGGSASLAGFTFIHAPTITSFSSTSGPIGSLVTINGTNLSNPTGITIGGVSAIPISNDGTTLVAMVMPGATTGEVSVSSAGGTANGSGNFIVIASQVPNTQQGNKLVGTGVAGFSRQGFSVSISADGNTAIVGGDGDNSSIGAAWVYTRSGGVWTQQGNKLVGTGVAGFSRQGQSVSISADGNTAIVGGYTDNSSFGAAWIYTRSGGVWTQQGNKLVGTGAVGAPEQGQSVSISADGNTAIVGGFSDNSGIGAAWVYTRSGGVWTQQGNKLVGTGAVGNSKQGRSVSISADGNTAIVGGNADNSGIGAAWIYTRSGGVWTQQGNKLVGTGAVGAAIQGTSVSISADGNTVILGGRSDNSNFGAAWVFTRSGGVWTQQGNKLVGTGGVGASEQGQSVSISADGNTAIVGGFSDNSGIGATWVYTRSGGVWTQQGNKLVGTGAVGVAYQGTRVSISADANTAIIGGLGDNSNTGAAWVYIFLPPAPTITTFTPTTAAAGAIISITGTNFNNTSAITLGGTPVTSFTVVSNTSIIAVVGSGSSGAVSLTTPSGTASLNGFTFIPPPTITSFSPMIAGAGALISITGTNFDNTSVITLGGTQVTSFTVVSSTSIIAVVGAGSTGAVSLTTPGGTASLAGFIFSPPPSISSFTETTGPVGTLVTINGNHLSYPLNIMIAGVPAIPISNDGNTLVAMVMPGATVGGVSVTTPGGTANGSGNFVVIPTQFPNFQQGNKLSGSGITSSAYLGWSVDVSADGNTAIVGSPVDNSLIGAALIYVRSGDTWTQQAKLVGSGNIGIAQQGTGVAISADGNTAIVGGNRDNDFVGASWIFTRTGTTWTQQGNKLVGSGAFFRPNQGWGVDMSADGNTVLIGGLGDLGGIGAAWIFTRSGGVWTQQGSKLVGTGGVGASYQGWSVALSADATTAIIGGFRDDNLKGAVWVFARSGDSWVQQGNKLVGSGAVGNAQQGWKLSISADGNTMIIGGNADDNSKGAAWVFTRSSDIWSQQGNKLVGSGAIGNASQGRSVALSADGNTAIIGGTADDVGSGASWTFTRTGDTWLQKCSKLIGSGAAGAANQGESVSISSDGNTAFVGGFTDNAGDGAAWSFIHIPPPVISNFDPTAAGSGTVISITGSSFTHTTAVSLGGTPVGSFTVVSSGSIQASVGSGSSGLVSVISVGCEASLSGFSFIPAPIITSFEPTAAATGALITITGSYFDNTSVITLGGTSVSSFTVVSSTTIVAIVGSGSSGAVSLTTPGGTASLDGFTYIPPPTIISFSPTIAATGALISITGTNFDGTTALTLGGTAVSSFTVVSSSTIVAIVGSGSSGAVSLTTPGGTASLAGFTFIPAPTITSFAPTSAGAGRMITITGTNFNGTSVITLGGTPVASFTVVSSTSIVVVVGTGATGALSLTTPGGTASLAGFTFIPAPTINAFAPTTAAAGALITITGTNFNNTSVVTLGGTSVSSFTVVSSTTIVAIVGSGSSGAVSLTTPGGSASLAGFTFIPAPTITAFAPTTAAAGALITITGTNFNNTSVVTLGGTSVS